MVVVADHSMEVGLLLGSHSVVSILCGRFVLLLICYVAFWAISSLRFLEYCKMKSMYGEIVLSTGVSNIEQKMVNFDLIFLAVCDQVRHKQAC